MYFQFLVEDLSGGRLICELMDKIVAQHPEVSYNCKSFKGIGGFTKKNTVKETKTGKLLNDLATYLRGFSKSLQNMQAAIVVVMDNDDRDTEAFAAELNQVTVQNMITTDHVFCIAVEEMEAWLLGDESAILAAYPNAKLMHLRSYKQDSICGTWEVLADVVYPGGLAGMKKACPAYGEIGEIKSEWASNIGRYMDWDKNVSPSFRFFASEIQKRIS